MRSQSLVKSHDEGGAGKGTDWRNLAGLAQHFAGGGDAASGCAALILPKWVIRVSKCIKI